MLFRNQALTISMAIAFALVTRAPAETPQAKKAAGGHIMFTPADIKWSDGPATLPAGAKMAVLEGDPSKKGPFTMRLLMPANYKIPAHWHPIDEHVTVISGSLSMGLGETLDTAKSMALPMGGFGVMPTGVHHFAWTSEGAIVQLHGMGPWGITYVNPSDDPRKKSSR